MEREKEKELSCINIFIAPSILSRFSYLLAVLSSLSLDW